MEHLISAEATPSRPEGAKPGLVTFDDPALNAETPPHLLDDPITPVERFFIRNNGRMPDADLSAKGWRLAVEGAVRRPLSLSPRQLERDFDVVSVTAVLECAGNGRVFYPEPMEGVLWTLGAVGCARFTGVRLADVLHEAGLRPEAFYVAHESPDLSIDGTHAALSRGLPLWKALSPETLIAFAMNGRPLQPVHGAPLRIVAPGFPGSAWQKWLRRLWVRDREHDGEKMTGYDYRLPMRRLEVGEMPSPAEMAVIEAMPVKSLITHPADGASVPAGITVDLRGFAWSGDIPVARVELSTDGGESWSDAELEAAEDRFGWRRFRLRWRPGAGRRVVIARAHDAAGRSQPLGSAAWNPRGYCNNRAHRIEVTVA